ncbi:MAG: flagellar motor switch protein FliG, partial [Pseudomonadota bacterium]
MSAMDTIDAEAAIPISNADAAAVMIMLMGDTQAAKLLSALDPDEIRLLGEKMVALGEIGPHAIVQAIAGFVGRAEKLGFQPQDRIGQVRGMMNKALG